MSSDPRAPTLLYHTVLPQTQHTEAEAVSALGTAGLGNSMLFLPGVSSLDVPFFSVGRGSEKREGGKETTGLASSPG